MATLKLEHNGQELWSLDFTARDIQILRHTMENPVQDFTVWLDEIVHRKIGMEQRALIAQALATGVLDKDALVDQFFNDPSYERKVNNDANL